MIPTTSKVFRVTAHNTAPDSENKIHDDGIARTYGFRGGLVPGVTVYGYMVPAVLERFGRPWLERGGMALRLVAPCYEGETVLTRCDGSTAIAADEAGSLYSSGVIIMNNVMNNVMNSAMNDVMNDIPERRVTPMPLHPLPEIDRRPVASAETIMPGRRLGTIRQSLDVTEEAAIPERLLRMANEIMVQNFRLGPWIHAGSEIRHHHLAACGQEITVCGVIHERFERKGRNFAVAALEMSANDGERDSLLVATVRHTFIYDLQKA